MSTMLLYISCQLKIGISICDIVHFMSLFCCLKNCSETSLMNVSKVILQTTNKLHGLSPRANYTDRATAACRRSDCQLLRIEDATWSA
jgi:hypothetical protein